MNHPALRFLIPAAMFAFLLALTYAYTYPGSEAMLDGRTDTVMSDDTDAVTLPYAYGKLVQTWHEHPSRLFYGSVYFEKVDPESGTANWMPWNERWIVVALAPFFPVEQLSTAYIFTLFLLSALAMYALGRHLEWSRSVSSGLAIGWAFCAYTRARAKVHGAFVGTYHLPLIFLGLSLVARGRTKRSLVLAALLFWLAMTCAHYYIVTCLFLAPLFLGFLAIQPEFRADWKRVSKRAVLALLPALTFLAVQFLKPIPSDVKLNPTNALPTSGETAHGEIHPFLYAYAAHPIDYLAGDIALTSPPKDTNVLRQKIDDEIIDELKGTGGNTHERTNGIRWLILILSIAALVFLFRGKFKQDPARQNAMLYFLLFAGFTFWLSLSPDAPLPGMGLSRALQAVISQVRVPSRAGIGVHFALLMLTGYFLSAGVGWRKYLNTPGVFPALMVLSYPPLATNIPMAPIRPVFTQLQQGECGAGMYFPFISSLATPVDMYPFVQRMRGSDCGMLNNMQNRDQLGYMMQLFPPRMDYLRQLPGDFHTQSNIERLVRCIPLTWIVFDPAVPQAWREETCRRLGWTMFPDLSCIAPNKSTAMQRLPSECR